MIYDFIIVGGGPCGMTLAHIINRCHKHANILLLDREKQLGGCHRVRRVESNLFTEHGPRIYIDNYKVFQQLMKEFGVDWKKAMVPYNFQFMDTTNNIIKKLRPKEFFAFILAYTKHFLNFTTWSRKLTVQQWMTQYDFGMEIQEYMDRACRLTDGAGADRYTVFEFLELMNQNVFYQVRQPSVPNDIGIFKTWTEYLKEQPHINIQTESSVDKIHFDSNKVTVHVNGFQTYIGKNIMLAIPPKHLVQLLDRSKIYDAFGSWNKLVKWERACRYLVYIPIFYHWTRKPIVLQKIWGLPEKSEWGLIFIVMSDYMKFPNSASHDVITIAISKPDEVSPIIGKSANQCNEDEILEEVYRQMLVVFPEIKKNPPDKQIISPGVFRNDMGLWETKDSAFMLTPAGFGPCESTRYPNLYSVGCHNGNGNYNFTALETAVQNALVLCHKIVPMSKNKYQMKRIFTIQKLVYMVCIIIVLIYLYYKF
jgi:hypothetical protein